MQKHWKQWSLSWLQTPLHAYCVSRCSYTKSDYIVTERIKQNKQNKIPTSVGINSEDCFFKLSEILLPPLCPLSLFPPLIVYGFGFYSSDNVFLPLTQVTFPQGEFSRGHHLI